MKIRRLKVYVKAALNDRPRRRRRRTGAVKEQPHRLLAKLCPLWFLSPSRHLFVSVGVKHRRFPEGFHTETTGVRDGQARWWQLR